MKISLKNQFEEEVEKKQNDEHEEEEINDEDEEKHLEEIKQDDEIENSTTEEIVVEEGGEEVEESLTEDNNKSVIGDSATDSLRAPLKLSTDSSSSISASANSKQQLQQQAKKSGGGLSDVINKLHKQQSVNHRSINATNDDQIESNENKTTSSGKNDQSNNSSSSSQIELANLLNKANLAQYLSAFIAQGKEEEKLINLENKHYKSIIQTIIGGDDISQLCEADDAEFKEICELVGMSTKPLHVKRLRKAIDDYKNAKKLASGKHT